MRTGAAWKMTRAPSSIASWTSSCGRHVLQVAAVDERHLGGALADAGARAVDGREAAADDDHPRVLQAADRHAAGRVVEVLERVDDAVGVLAGDAQLVRLVAADADVDRVVARSIRSATWKSRPRRMFGLKVAPSSQTWFSSRSIHPFGRRYSGMP